MYYPSFYASVRPYETVGTLGPVRERLENPLDLSVKQVTRAEGSCGPDHEDIQIMMEHRKLAVAAAAAGLQTGPFSHQIPLLDGLYGYKHFGTDPQCSIPGTGLLGQSLSSFCASGSTAGGVNPQFGLMPGLLQQSRETLTLEAPPPPPLTPFPIDPSHGIPYHMRINNAAAAAAAMAINNANQRAAMYGHGALPPPHIASSFGATLPHLSLYSDLLNDMTRRPVEQEKGAFSAIPSLRSPAEPATRFSDHLQRLREQHLQQSKCTGPCCLPSPGHGHSSLQSGSHLGSAATGTSGCNCCSVPLPQLASSGSLPTNVTLHTTNTSVPLHTLCNVKDSCIREIATNSDSNACNNNKCSPKNVQTPVSDTLHPSHLHIESQNTTKHDIKNASSHQKPLLWNPSQSIQSSSSHNGNMYSQKDITVLHTDNAAKTLHEKSDDKSNCLNSRSVSNTKQEHSIKEESPLTNEIITKKNLKPEIDCTQMREHFREVISIEGDCHDTGNANNSNLVRSKLEIGPLEPSMSVTQHYMSERAHLSHSNPNNNGIAPSTTTTAFTNNKVTDSFNENNLMMEKAKSPRAKCSHENQTSKSDGSYDNNILSAKSIANSALNIGVPEQQLNGTIGTNGTTAINANGHHFQQRPQKPQQSNEIKLSHFKSYFGNGKTHNKNSQKHDQHESELKQQQTNQASAISVSVKGNVNANTITNTNTNTITKQLKDYKLLPKNININPIDKNKRNPKETKTVEVQCDGPDWTPIVLPQQFKSRLQKARRKMTCDSKNNTLTKQLMNHKKETKRRKKCKQQHNHRSRSRSRSSSASTVSSTRSSPERKRHLSSYCDVAIGKSRKRSMLQCLVNSDGFVADNIKRKCRDADLFADPSQLSREERALQRAMKHFEQLQQPSDKSGYGAEEHCDTTRNKSSDNNNNCNNNNCSNNDTSYNHDCGKSRNGCKKHHKSNCSLVSDSKFKNQTLEATSKSQKKQSKKSREYEVDSEVSRKCNSSKMSKKMDAKEEKRKLRERILEKLLDDEQKSEEDDDTIQRKNSKKKKKKKKTKINEKCDDDAAKRNEDTSQPNELTMQWTTQRKKVIVNVRRRRFRSGLDMIRHPHRRKKTRVNHGHGSNARNGNGATGEECVSRSSGCDLKANEYTSNRNTNSESGNGSLPTEMKRLMVNKALGETLLHRAARSNRKDVVHYCLESNICDINTRDNAGYTPLHECCTRGHLEIARTLLQHGADVNASAAGGIRPLHDAIENNHVEVSRLLLSYGADPNISTYSGLTPLKLARSKTMVEFLKDANESGFNVFDGAPSDGDGVESDDFLFEVSDTPLDPTYRIHMPNSSLKSTNFLRLSDVLRRTGLTKDEFVNNHTNIEIVSIARHEFETATISQLLTPSRHEEYPVDSYIVDVVQLDDNIRNILGIETVRLR